MKTAELLEAILLHVDMRTILTSTQLVSRQWHDLIAHSPALQQALYFKPSTTAAAADSSVPSPRGTTLNPLLAEVFRFWFREPPPGESNRWSTFSLKDLEWFYSNTIEHFFGCRAPENDEDKEMKTNGGSATLKSIMYPEATWRRMLVRQPPVLALGLVKQKGKISVSNYSYEFYRLEFQDDSGLQMGHLYDLTHM